MSIEQIIVANAYTYTPSAYRKSIYVGRKTSFIRAKQLLNVVLEDYSLLGNPFSVETFGRELSIEQYKEWLDTSMLLCNAESKLVNNLVWRVKRGEFISLICWCAPKACHAGVIKELIMSMVKRGSAR